MIINIRGTGGSGKSTLVREMMRRCTSQQKVFVDGRRQPLGYLCSRESRPPLFVPGHYETPCGGCDTIKTVDAVYELVRAEASAGCDVIFEGIMAQDDVRRCVETAAQYEVLVLALDVPLEVCLQSIRDRRKEAGDERPLNPLNTTHRAASLRRNMERLTAAGVRSEWLSREAALARCCEALGLPLDAPETREADAADEPFQLT